MKEKNNFILKANSISKYFGPVCALKDVDFEIKNGETVGLAGDNGAGKSTLIKILSGALQMDEGQIEFEGNPVKINQPLDAFKLGIETIYQDLCLFDNLDFTQNIFAGREYFSKGIGKIFGFVDNKRMRMDAMDKIKNISFNLPTLDQRINTLSGGQRQAVSIARSVFWGKKIIIMDEPTAALGVRESNKVLELIKEIKNHLKGVVIITHNIEHMIRVADRVIVLRNGMRAGEVTCIDYSEKSHKKLYDNVVKLMTGLT